MSRTLRAPGWGSRAVLTGALALVLAVLTAVGLAPRANAAFSSSQCGGADVLGRGASFAQAAHGAWEVNFHNVFCGGDAPDILYDPAGSGAGISGMEARGGADPRFGGTDDPLTKTQKEKINAGTGAAGDEGLIHQIPIAVGAVAPLVNFPTGCDPKDLPVAAQTDEQNLDADGTPDDVIRVKFTKAQWEAVWAQGASEGGPAPAVLWSDVFETLKTKVACEKPIIRVVRFDKSGTTFAFKDYLDKINGARKWNEKFQADNREWPGAVLGPREDCPKVSGVFPTGPGADSADPNSAGADNLTSSCSSNATNLVATLSKFDGSVGYADIASARAGGLAIEAEKNDNDTFWTQLQNGKEEFKEPTSDVNGFRKDGFPGANCKDTEFKNVPATTLDEWNATSGVNSQKGYGLCTLTFALAFDDNADAYSAQPAAVEEARARTVKDYLTYVVSDGQSQLFANDYTPLPTAIAAISKAGVELIEWQKGEGGGGKEEGGKKEEEAKKDTTPPPTVKPSNVFSLLRKTISSKTGGATLSVKLPGAGTLEMVATAKNGKKTITVGRAVLNANQAGTFNLPLKASGAAKKVLRSKGKLPVKLELTFTPTGGDANESASSLVLKMKKPAKRG